MATAATERYLIEAVNGRVNLCESQGDRWVTIRRNITWQTARNFGFNPDSPAVQAVFDEAQNIVTNHPAGCSCGAPDCPELIAAYQWIPRE